MSINQYFSNNGDSMPIVCRRVMTVTTEKGATVFTAEAQHKSGSVKVTLSIQLSILTIENAKEIATVLSDLSEYAVDDKRAVENPF
jgi:hypothetical protein